MGEERGIMSDLREGDICHVCGVVLPPRWQGMGLCIDCAQLAQIAERQQEQGYGDDPLSPGYAWQKHHG